MLLLTLLPVLPAPQCALSFSVCPKRLQLPTAPPGASSSFMPGGWWGAWSPWDHGQAGTCVSCSAQLSLALCRDTQGLTSRAAAVLVPRLGKPLSCCQRWAQGSSPGDAREPLPRSLSSYVSLACCWHLSSPEDLPRGLSPSPLLPLLLGIAVALAHHSQELCQHVPGACANVSRGVQAHGNGGQSWNLDTRHHPFLPSTAPRSVCRTRLGAERG